MGQKYTAGIRTRVRTAVGPLFEMLHIYMVLARLCKTHTYPVWGLTMLRQIRSTGPMRAPCFRGLSPGHFMLNVYWVLFLCVPGTLAAPCLTCYGFQPGCTFETTGQCPMAVDTDPSVKGRDSYLLWPTKVRGHQHPVCCCAPFLLFHTD